MWPFDMFSKKMKYTEEAGFTYHSKRYDKFITIPPGYQSDGATYAPDLSRTAFFVHDRICQHGKFDDDTPVTNWQASAIYYDILGQKGFWFRKYHRRFFTFLGGGEKLKKF